MERVLHALARTSCNPADAICRRRIRARHYVKKLVTESVHYVLTYRHQTQTVLAPYVQLGVTCVISQILKHVARVFRDTISLLITV